MAKQSNLGLTPSQISIIATYINARLTRTRIPLSELAQLVGLSEFHFARRFKASTQLSPHQFVLRCRLERARELLSADHHSLADIAQQVGFADHSHLTRMFKQTYGVTPSEYRKQ